jgi:hypothetical protein
MSKIEKKRIPKESPTRHIENVAGFTLVWLSLFMGGSVNCKLPSTPPSNGLRRIKHLTWFGTILKHPQMCSYGSYHRTFNVTRKCYSMKSGIWSPIKEMCVCLFVCFILRLFPTVFQSYRRVVS